MISLFLSPLFIPPHPPQGVWHPGGSQREVQHRRLRCEPDLLGAGVPQLRPVPALQQEIDTVRGSSISLFLSLSVCPSVVCISPLCVADLCTWARLCDAPLSYDQVLIYIHTDRHCAVMEQSLNPWTPGLQRGRVTPAPSNPAGLGPPTRLDLLIQAWVLTINHSFLFCSISLCVGHLGQYRGKVRVREFCLGGGGSAIRPSKES